MSSKAVIVADATTGSVINMSSNPEFGYVRVEQSVNQYDDNGFLRRKKLSAIISAPIGDLQEAGYYAGQLLDGKIIIQESTTPWNEKNPERDLKVAGETGIVCTVEGQPIYRRTLVSFINDAQDDLIQHDNVDQLRTAYAQSSGSVKAMKPSTDFDIN
jgi:hypothetical protein